MAIKTSWAAGDVLAAADLTDTFAAKFTTPSAWTAYTPTIAAYTGAFGTITLNGAAYCQIGKLVIVRVSVTIASVGTGTVGIKCTLPTAATSTNGGGGHFTEVTVTGWSCPAYFNSVSEILIAKYDGTNPVSGTNSKFVGTFTYEAA